MSYQMLELQSSTVKCEWQEAENLNKKSVKLLNNNTNNYECLLKIMLYCPSSGHELLSTLGVSLVFQVSSVKVNIFKIVIIINPG